MTINGGKPHEVGDRGQRYEVTFFNPVFKARQVLGWTNSKDDAERMVEGVKAHPSWSRPKIRDRQEAPNGR